MSYKSSILDSLNKSHFAALKSLIFWLYI